MSDLHASINQVDIQSSDNLISRSEKLRAQLDVQGDALERRKKQAERYLEALSQNSSS